MFRHTCGIVVVVIVVVVFFFVFYKLCGPSCGKYACILSRLMRDIDMSELMISLKVAV